MSVVSAEIPLFAGGIEIALLAGVLILLFGASKIPALARNMGRGVSEFQQAREDETEIEVEAES